MAADEREAAVGKIDKDDLYICVFIYVCVYEVPLLLLYNLQVEEREERRTRKFVDPAHFILFILNNFIITHAIKELLNYN